MNGDVAEFAIRSLVEVNKPNSGKICRLIVTVAGGKHEALTTAVTAVAGPALGRGRSRGAKAAYCSALRMRPAGRIWRNQSV